ncbi:MAG: hypothetical protein ACP5D2_00905 [Candidatus Nanoarchaeia archaeon]
MKKLIFLLLVLLISQASAISVSSTPIDEVIIPDYDQPAHFKITIENASAGTYKIYSLLTGMELELVVDGKSYNENKDFYIKNNKTLDVYVTPSSYFEKRGHYTFEYIIKQDKGESYENWLTVKVVDLEDAIEISSDIIDASSGKVRFYIENKEQASLEDIQASFSSILFDNVEKEFSLNPLEKTYIEIDVDDKELKTLKAGSYIITANFDTDMGEQAIKGKIYIGEQEGITTQEDSSGLLIHTNTITKINSGNVPKPVQIQVEKNIISRLFTNFNTEPLTVRRSSFSIIYTWNKELQPGEVYNVKATTNYLLPLAVIFVLGLAIWGFKHYLQTKIDIKKSVNHVKTKGGEFALRVKIRVKARKDIENLSIIDKIPSIVKVYEKFETIKPDQKDTKNRRLRWSLGDLKAGEERAFSYVVYSKVGVVGKFSLPSATAVFEQQGNIHEQESNKVFFLSDQAKE